MPTGGGAPARVRVDPDNAAAVAAICRALDGMPLAIELAAARVRALSVEQIKARLDDRFGLLTAGDRSAAPRQQTLRAAIEWSYELLDAAERILFRRLSVFAGWSLEMAEQVCADEEIPAGDVLGLIAALVDKSLGDQPGRARPGALPDAGHDQGIRGGSPGQGRRGGRGPARLRDYSLRTAEQTWRSGWRGSRPPGRTGWTSSAGTTSTRATWPGC